MSKKTDTYGHDRGIVIKHEYCKKVCVDSDYKTDL